VCVDLDSSILSTDVAIRAYEKPSSDLIITGDKVKENFDAYNVKYYTVIGKQDIVLDAALLIHEEANSVYNYEFYWKNGSLSFYSNIETPFGIFDGADNVLSNATLDDLRNGEKVRWYVIQTDVNGICSTRDSVQIIINYGIDPINVITPSTKDENKIWTIENIEQFPGNTVVIYNRWGSIVRYYGPNEFVSWDGTNENGRAPCTGPVTLLR
jgi:gliding motility-associated-like protein